MVNRPQLSAPASDPAGYDGRAAARILEGATGVIPPDVIQKALQAAGIPLPEARIAARPADLEGLDSALPLPWVMKVVGPLHKTDLGGVAFAETFADAVAVLQGYRGRPGMDLDRLADLLVRVSLLGRDVPGIEEMDINPVMGVGDRLVAVDVRVRKSSPWRRSC